MCLVLLIILIIFLFGFVREGYRNGRYHRAYVPGVYPGYIPLWELHNNIPSYVPDRSLGYRADGDYNSLPLARCIDGDDLRPCWDIEDGKMFINR